MMHDVHLALMSKLIQFRAQQGITQRALADRVGVDQSIISRLERGEMLPSLQLAAAIEEVTGGVIPAVSWVSSGNGAA